MYKWRIASLRIYSIKRRTFFSLRIQEQRLFEDAVCYEDIFLKSLPIITHLQWRHFTTTTRILQGIAFVCKIRLLLFKPHWDYQIKI